MRYKKNKKLYYGEYLDKLFPEFKADEKNPKKIRNVTFQVTEDCCLKCSYCYQHHKTKNKMDFNTAKIFIDDLLADKYDVISTKNTYGILVEFIGGEPFMEVDLMEQIWTYLYDQMVILNHPWLLYTAMSLCSNGVLIQTDKIKRFLNKYKGFWHLGISIDGNKELHDMCRIDLQGKGSYDRAMAAVRYINDTYGIWPETKMTIAPANIQFLSNALISLIENGYNLIPANCVFEEGWTYEHAKIYYQELKKVADYIINNNYYDKIEIHIFDEDIGHPLDSNIDSNWCGGTADANMALDFRGKFYPCIRYMESSLNGHQKPLSFGDVYNGYLQTEEAKENYNLLSNLTRKSQSTDECFNCPIASGCAWCSALNYEINGTPNKRLTFICPMHKARTLANTYYWNKLAHKLNITNDLVYKLNLSKEESLKIITEDEFNLLINLSYREEKN